MRLLRLSSSELRRRPPPSESSNECCAARPVTAEKPADMSADTPRPRPFARIERARLNWARSLSRSAASSLAFLMISCRPRTPPQGTIPIQQDCFDEP